MALSDWSTKLREARKAVRLSQRALAERAGVSPSTVKAYELGLRNPSRVYLTAILDSLKVEARTRNAILTGAGFAVPDTLFPPDRAPKYFFTVEEAAEEVEKCRWPACVLNDVMELVAANQLVQRLWGVDLNNEFTGPLERNLLGVASDPRFAEKVANWDEAVGTAIGILKGHHFGPETRPEGSSAYFSEVMKRFLEGDPRYVRRFLELWEVTPAREPKSRWSYPIIFNEPGLGTLHFQVQVSTCSEPDGLAFNDWIPLDAATWEALGAIAQRERAG